MKYSRKVILKMPKDKDTPSQELRTMSQKVLVVDPNSKGLELARSELSKANIQIITAGDCQECFMKLQYDRPDLILLEGMMPGKSGFEICDMIKHNPKTRSIPVVIYTILDREWDRRLAMEAGADGFARKYHEDLQTLVSGLKHQLMDSAFSDGSLSVSVNSEKGRALS